MQIESFFKYGDTFVSARDAQRPYPNDAYIEGAICITVRDEPFLTLEHWDLVDQLWLYLLDGIENIRLGKPFETYFPDQPLQLSFTFVSQDWLALSLISGSTTRRVKVARDTFLQTLCHAAAVFFEGFERVVMRHRFNLIAIRARIEGD